VKKKERQEHENFRKLSMIGEKKGGLSIRLAAEKEMVRFLPLSYLSGERREFSVFARQDFPIFQH